MTRDVLRHWLNRMRYWARGRRAVLPRERLRRRLVLEGLEGRCLPSTVTNLNDSGPGSLRDALATTPAGGTVDFQPGLHGTITLTSGELLVSTDLTVAGPGQDVLSVSGNGSARVLEIASGVTLTLTSLTLTGGSGRTTVGGVVLNGGILQLTDARLSDSGATRGAGLYNAAGSTATLTHVLVSGNSALDLHTGYGYGGGIYNDVGSTLALSACTLQDNAALSGSPEAGGPGGGLYNAGTLTVTASTFRGNGGEPGGAVNNTGTLTVTTSTFSGNGAGAGGGGIYNTSAGTLSVTDSLLNNNQAVRAVVGNIIPMGAGLYNAGRAALRNVTLSGNSTVGGFGYGGGVYNQGTLELTSCTLGGNSGGYGGGFYNTATLAVSGCTLSGNTSAFGGGLWNNSPTMTVRNTIVAKNTANGTGPDVNGPISSQGHNLVGDGSGGSGFADTDLVGTADAPLDPLLGPLQDNGGPTQTMAPLIGSPAIGAGDPSDAPATDQRGARRVVHHQIDIGAYQVQPAPAPACAVAAALLWPHDHALVDVGLSMHLPRRADPSTQVAVLVYGNDGAQPGDAAIGPGTLHLRARRRRSGNGRVYLVVVQASDASGQSGIDVCTVGVPYDHSPAAVAAVQAEAAAAAAFYRAQGTAPDGYTQLGEGSAAAAGGDPAREVHAAALAASLPEPSARLSPPPIAAPVFLPSRRERVAKALAEADRSVGPVPVEAAWRHVLRCEAGDDRDGADRFGGGERRGLLSGWVVPL